MTCQCHYSVFQDLFFSDVMGKMMLFKPSGVRKVIQYREGNEGRITKEKHRDKGRRKEE